MLYYYIPFYDSSVPAKRKSTWENIKSVLKTYFDTIYATINNLKNYVSWESANKFVGKNLLENHAVSTTTPIYGTLMYTVDSNGVITGSGTSNSNDSTFWIWGDGWGISHTIPIEKTRLEIGKTYTLYSGNNSTNAGVIFYFYNGDTFISSASTWTGTGKIDMTVPANTTHICAILRVRNGATIDDDKFYPMITYQDVPITLPNDYEPYIYDNTQVMSYVDNGILGAKNRLPLTLENLKNWNTGGTWSDNVFTHTNGVTYTVTTDNAGNVKNISVNGSPSVVTTFTVGELTGLSGNWILNGIIGGSQSTYGIQLYDKTSATWTSQYSVDGDAIVNLEDSTHNYRFAFFVRNDVTVSNISIKPMLRLITDTDSTYQPYAMTNVELTRVASSVSTIAPTPSGSLTESTIVDTVNSAINTNNNASSLFTVQKYSNEKKVRRVLNGANIPSGTSMTATGIGTWTDKAINQITSADEADWWYDAAFVVPVYYMLTSDTSVVTGKTYYTRSGSGTEQDPYVYTAVGSPSAGSLSTYYEQYSDDVDISIKFDPSGDTATLGGYIFDSTTGKICIKFGNSITVNTARIAVDITYTRNEVG